MSTQYEVCKTTRKRFFNNVILVYDINHNKKGLCHDIYQKEILFVIEKSPQKLDVYPTILSMKIQNINLLFPPKSV